MSIFICNLNTTVHNNEVVVLEILHNPRLTEHGIDVGVHRIFASTTVRSALR